MKRCAFTHILMMGEIASESEFVFQYAIRINEYIANIFICVHLLNNLTIFWCKIKRDMASQRQKYIREMLRLNDCYGEFWFSQILLANLYQVNNRLMKISSCRVQQNSWKCNSKHIWIFIMFSQPNYVLAIFCYCSEFNEDFCEKNSKKI